MGVSVCVCVCMWVNDWASETHACTHIAKQHACTLIQTHRQTNKHKQTDRQASNTNTNQASPQTKHMHTLWLTHANTNVNKQANTCIHIGSHSLTPPHAQNYNGSQERQSQKVCQESDRQTHAEARACDEANAVDDEGDEKAHERDRCHGRPR